MRTIHQLPQQVISKIAAGEVIERPAYAVKELVENAIDAKADYITIHIEEAGLKKISVTDNGIGMTKEDLIECFKPHTTSKISSEEELIGVTSLGFRGEALSSISAISNLTIKSKTKAASEGTEVGIKNGVVEKVSPVGIPIGTTMHVEQLFHTVPVRKKFLKTQATEFRHIVEIVTQYALAFPKIRFFLTHNKKIILDLSKNQTLTDRMKLLLGKDIFEQLIPIAAKDSYLTIQGYLSKPQLTTTTISKQFIFVNNRRVHDKFISAAVKEAYGNLLEQHSYPLFVLFLTIPFERVDVNVHPRKDQVNFVNRKALIDQIQAEIRETLEKQNITFHKPVFFSPRSGSTNSFAGKLLKDSVTPWGRKSDKINNNAPIEQLHNLYLVTQSTHGMIMIDQHAAHERILFEQFSKEFKEKKQLFSIYTLPKPETIELSITDKELLLEHTEIFTQLGFTIDTFQGNTLLISTIPNFLKDREIKEYIRELLDTFSEEKNVTEIDNQTKKMIAYLACRNAVKAGDKLTRQEMKDLVKKLEETKNNETCPHGRPTKIIVSLQDLHKLFKRK
ncbi:MAG TPA: DNA mismatch repair endonuclease MutL [Candidatus Saccharimonadales bacterium]|nr:DNA mismatch repair endonuclease MutL [Candidatus Saccharimonadales bacterium]